jgi:hypothetical protein
MHTERLINEFPASLIEPLIPLFNTKALDAALNELAKRKIINNQFILKMEITRLHKPCIRGIDLRQKSKTSCQSYVFNGIAHYLTLPAIREFERLVRLYKRTYSVGVYEYLLSSLDSLDKENHQELAISASKFDFELFNVEHLGFGLYQSRSEDRIYYSSEVSVSTTNQQFNTRTTDISTAGVRVLLPENVVIRKGDIIDVKYTGIAKEYVDKALSSYISYRVVGVDGKGSKTWVRAVRNDSTPQVNLFLTKFIAGRIVFDRINSSDLSPTLLNKGYENLYIPKSTGLPLFFKNNGELAHVLVSDNNKGLFEYWKNHQDINTLAYALKCERINDLLCNTQNSDSLIYSFSLNIKGKELFFCASEKEFKTPVIKNTFLSTALKQGTLKLLKLTLNITDCSFNQLGLDEEGLSRVSIERINQITTVGVLHDLTTPEALAEINENIENNGSLDNIATLRQFLLSGERVIMDVVPAAFVSKRKGLRYIHDLQLRANHNNKVYSGTSKNFSVDGLLIELKTRVDAMTGDTLNIEMPSDDKSSSIYSHPYRIVKMNKDKTILHLRLSSDEHYDDNKKFFGDLLKKSHGKIKADYGPEHSKGLLDGLFRLYSRFGNINVLFFERKNKILKPKRLMTNDCGPLSSLLSVCTEKGFNLFPILNSSLTGILNSTDFIEENTDSTFRTHELYIFVDHSKGTPKVLSRLSSELPTPKIRSLFLLNGRKNGQVFVLQVHLMKTGALDLNFINDKLIKIQRNARFHLDIVKSELENISVAMNIIDVTRFTLDRLGLTQ